MTSVVNNISFSILMQDPETKKIIESGDEQAFEDILYSKWGVDTAEPWEVVSCNHRPNPNDPYTFNGPIVLAVERLDAEHIKSGKASFEAQVAAKGDIGLQMELARIGKQGISGPEGRYSSENVYKKKGK